MRKDSDHITLPFLTNEKMVEELVSDAFEEFGDKV
jgi:hypothetical protein